MNDTISEITQDFYEERKFVKLEEKKDMHENIRFPKSQEDLDRLLEEMVQSVKK